MNNILKKIVTFSFFFLGIISVAIGSLFIIKKRERSNITKKYEIAFLNFYNSGVLNDCIHPIMEYKYMDAKGLRKIDLDISYLIKSYIEYVIKLNNYDYGKYNYKDNYLNINNNILETYIDNIITYYNSYPLPDVDEYMYFYLTEEKNNACSERIDTCFVRASLSELGCKLTEEKLIRMLETIIPHNSNDKYEGWVLNGKKDLYTVLPGGIVIDYSGDVTIYEKNDHIKYKSIKILSPIFELNLLSNKKKYQDVNIEISYIDEEGIERTIKSKAEQYSEKYVFDDALKKIYNYNNSSSRKNLMIYSLGNKALDTLSFDTFIKAMVKQNENFNFPDLIHLACIGDFDSIFFIDDFKNKYKNNGLFKGFKVKDTMRIEVRNDILEDEKELRQLILDDGNNTKILCLFKIIYLDEPNDHIKDILTYIIPEDKMNLSYEEMYKLAFND